MSLYQTLYYMGLVGGMAGLFSWALTALLSSSVLANREAWLADFVAASVLGLLIGALTVAFSDKWSGNRVVGRYVLMGGVIGVLAGALGGFAMRPITSSLGDHAFLARLLCWTLAGGLIGLGLGLRWVVANKMRVVHACLGGLIGGAIGGALFHALGSRVPDLTQAMGFVMVGLGICFGITLAPILLRDGILKFVSSGDARAQAKLGRAGKEWEIQQGDSCLIGSESLDLNKTTYAVGVQVFIPDAAIAPKHAIVFSQEGRFYIARHRDINNQAGLARFVLRVRGKTVITSQELRDGDDILIGRSAVKFSSKKDA